MISVFYDKPQNITVNKYPWCFKWKSQNITISEITQQLYELFWKIPYFKEEQFVEFEIRLTLNYGIFQKKFVGYSKKIKLASKL